MDELNLKVTAKCTLSGNHDRYSKNSRRSLDLYTAGSETCLRDLPHGRRTWMSERRTQYSDNWSGGLMRKRQSESGGRLKRLSEFGPRCRLNCKAIPLSPYLPIKYYTRVDFFRSKII